VKDQFHVLQLMGVLITSAGYFVYGFFVPDIGISSTTTWAFFRSLIAYIILAFAIVYAERLLKLRKCSAPDVAFHMGWQGIVCCGLFMCIYMIFNAAMEETQVTTIQFFAGVFSSGTVFGYYFSYLFCMSFVVNIAIMLVKYSSSLKMLSVCLLFHAIAM